jgi:glutamine synthetase
MSPARRNFVKRLLHHAAASCLFDNPTIQGYKPLRRYVPASYRAN